MARRVDIPDEAAEAAARAGWAHDVDSPVIMQIVDAAAPHIARQAQIDELKRLKAKYRWYADRERVDTMYGAEQVVEDLQGRIDELEAGDDAPRS